MENKRIDWIDWLKAIGIFLVSLGHSNCVPNLRKYIYSFHMPLFFIASGMTLKPEKYDNIKSFIIDKSKKLLLPYLFINIFTLPFYYIYCNYMAIKDFNIFNIIKGIVIGNDDIITLISGPSWLILTLFLAEVLFYILYKLYNGDKKHLFNASIILIIIGYVEGITSRKILMPWHINTVPVACACTIIGYLMYNIYREKRALWQSKKINYIYSIILIIIGAYISVYVNGKVSFGGNNYKSIILTYASLFSTITGLILILMKIKKAKLLSFIGRNSLIILAIHKPIIYIIRYFVPSFKEASWNSTIIGVIMFIGMIPLTWLIEKFMPFLVGNLKRYNKKGKIVIYSVLIIILLSSTGITIAEKWYLYKYKINILKQDYIAHALGGIEGNQYTNSKEAIENSYSKGIKIYEADVRLTSDEKLVLVHGWSEENYNNNLGVSYNKENAIMSYDKFMNTKIKEKYTTMAYKDLVDFMRLHNDVYVMIDIGNQNYEKTKSIYEKIVSDSNNDSKILNRLIVGGHTTNMIKAVKDVYDFQIINLYWPSKDKRKDSKIDTKEEFVKYCREKGISGLSTSTETYKEEKEIIEYFKKNGLIVCVFTENDDKKKKDILKNVDLIGVDFI